MIVPSMNKLELAHEIFSDSKTVLKRAIYYYPKMRRIAIKSKNKYYHQIFDYKSQRKNNWIILIDYYLKEPTVAITPHFLDANGFNAIMINPLLQQLTHISSHFLDRYNQRFLKHENISRLEILKKFITHNYASIIHPLSFNEGVSDRFFGRTNHGTCLGYRENIGSTTMDHYNTFISIDMIYKSQQNYLDMTSNDYSEYWNEEFSYTGLPAFNSMEIGA